MEYLPFGAAIAVLAILLWRKERQLESMLAASELARKEQAEQAAKEREALIAQVSAPELAPSIAAPEPTGEVLHVPYDDDSAHDEYMEARAAGEVA